MLVACGHDHKKRTDASIPTVEAVCTDGIDNDKDGKTDCDDLDCQSPGGDCVSAPALDRTVASTIAESAAILYTGDNPLQKGADAKAFERARVAMLKGFVVDEKGSALAGVRVSVQDHAEYGYTFTRKDGSYDMVVNGGTKLLLNYSTDGRLDAQRAVTPGWQRHHFVDSVGLTSSIGETFEVKAESESAATFEGPKTSDDFGERQAFVVFQPGTTAEAVMNDGSTEPLSKFTVTVTEYPLDNSQQYLPGTPQVTGLAYGLDFAVKEVKALGATHVKFSNPVSVFVENFLELPVGSTVPLSYYDATSGQWEDGKRGAIIEILDVTDGEAVIDADGSGKAADSSHLDELGITKSDLEQLAKQYDKGTQLQFGRVSHFSAYKAQVNVKAPKGAIAPNPATLKAVVDQPTRIGNLLVEPRAVIEDIPVSGTPYALTYQSNRTTAYVAGRTLDIPITFGTVPTGLKRATVRVTIAGKVYEAKYDAKANQTFSVTWDGFDSLNRLLQGPQIAQVLVSYVYAGVLPNGKTSSKPFEVTLASQVELQIGQWDFKGYELGGFGINVLHAYDPALHTVFYGDGNQRSAENVALITKSANKDTSFNLGTPDSLLVLPDGSLLVTDDEQNDASALGRVLRITTEGKPSVLYGPGASGTAAKVALMQPQGLVALDDGSIVVSDIMKKAIRRIALDGSVTTLAGSNAADNPKITYTFSNPDGLALGQRQELYIIDGGTLLKLEGGKLSTFAGGGAEADDGIAATDAKITKLSGVAVDSQGLVVVSDRDGNRIRKVLADGTITTIAGKGTANFSGDGRNAIEAELSGPRGLAIGPDGSLYVVDQGNNRVRRITPDGLIQTVIGGGTSDIVDGVLSTNVKLNQPDGIAMGPDGALYIATIDTVLKITPDLPTLNEKDNLIPSVDGRTLYRFDYRGKHLETVDAMSGVSVLKFGYDSKGYLSNITDESDVTTEIKRNAGNLPETIVGPYGQETQVRFSDNGWAAKVTDAINRDFELTWNPVTGLLSSVKDPTAKVGTFDYDVAGRLEKVTNPTGYKETIGSSTTTDGFASIKVTNPSGKVTEFLHKPSPAGGLVQAIVRADGTRTDFTTLSTSVSSTSPDGTSYQTYYVADAAFGPQSMVPSESTMTLPSGKKLVTEYQQMKKVSDISNILSLQDWYEQQSMNGRVFATKYSRSDKQQVSTTAEGRTSTTTFDDNGLPIRIEGSGMPVVEVGYDEDGRIASLKQTADGKTRTEVRGYGDGGWISSRTNAVGQTMNYTWDAVGRPKQFTRPDSRSTSWGFDNADDVTSLTPPGRGTHQFAYDDATKLLKTETPPAVPMTSASGLADGVKAFEYGANYELTKINLSDGRNIAFAYNDVGQLKTETLEKTKLTFGYAKGLLTSINRSDGVKVNVTYDGSLPTGSTWSGAISGTVSATYDKNLWLSSITVNNASTVNYTYDKDGLLVGASSTAGGMTITRNADNGFVTSTALGNVTTENDYNGFGELSVTTTSVSTKGIFGQIIERDDLGRITSIEEQVGATPHKLSFTYNNLGRLETATRDGVTTTYKYDANGNRASVRSGTDAAVAAKYDAQDRILSFGSQTYKPTATGNLESRTDGTKTVGLTYDELGNLTSASLKDIAATTTIDYVIDGFGRRVGRKVNGTFDKKWLYRDGLRPVAEVDSVGVFTHFVYANSQSGAPDFLIRSGVLYRIVKDYLGSIRMVVNASTGAVAQSLEYDAFGRVLSETGAGFQPFGFAGGIYDVDTKLVRFGARDYDPGMGRWTNKDPIGFAGGDTNIYAYVGNDPVNRLDASGLRDWSYAEVQEYLLTYREDLLTCRWLEKKYLQYTRSRENGLADFHYTKLNKGDRFDITGAGDYIDDGEMGNFVAGYAAGVTGASLDWWLVRMAGSFYNLRGAGRNKPKYPGKPSYSVDMFGIFDDDWGSYFYIESGYRRGRMDAGGHP
jgi:RHS repeat-associated protein